MRQIETRLIAWSLAVCGMGLFGAATVAAPFAAVGLVAVGIAAVLVFTAPVATLIAIVSLTAVVPYGVQNQFGVGGGQESPGLLASDVLLLLALVRAILVLAYRPIETRRLLFAAGIVLFLGVAAFELIRGVSSGNSLNVAGAEFRRFLGFGVFLVAMPIVDNARDRERLMKGLLGVGLALGFWGLTQWFVQLPFSAAGDVGVREGVALTQSGRGQVQGGLFAFPVAVIIAYAALVSGNIRSGLGRVLVSAAFAANAASLLLTYERTFWVVTVGGIALVTLKARASQRMKVLLVTPIVVLVAVSIFATLAPAELSTARERLLSLGQYKSDNSLRYRLVESQFVTARIRAHPTLGNGLGATIHWGRPWDRVPARDYTFSHNGYLWLAWRVGIPAALLLVLLIAGAITLRGPPVGGFLEKAFKDGAQASLLAILIATITFPSFNWLGITAVMGTLLALSTQRPVPRHER